MTLSNWWVLSGSIWNWTEYFFIGFQISCSMYLSESLNVFVQIKKCIWFQIDYSIEAVTFEVWLEIKWLDPNSTSAHARTLPPHCFCSRPTASDLFFIIRTMQCNAMKYNDPPCYNAIEYNAKQCNTFPHPLLLICFISSMQCNEMEHNGIQLNTLQYTCWMHCTSQ